MLDKYLGYNWNWELITTAEDLFQQWDEQFGENETSDLYYEAWKDGELSIYTF